MNTLLARAEHDKLTRVLGALPPSMADMPADVLRHLRLAVEERNSTHHRIALSGLARLTSWLPDLIVCWLVRWRLTPRVTARTITWLPSERVVALARRLPAGLIAEIAGWLDVRAARDLIRQLPQEQVVEIADALRARGDVMTLGGFVALVPDAVISAMAERIPDEGELLRIVYYMDAPERVDHIIRQLPPERVHRALMLLSDSDSRPLWPALLALVSHAGPTLQRELGELAAQQGEDVLNAIIQVAYEDQLWQDLLPVVGNLAPALQQRIVNLDSLLSPDVLRDIIAATGALDLWPVMLEVASAMDPHGRDLLAEVVAELPREMLEHIMNGAMLRPAWPLICDLLLRIPQRHDEARALLMHRCRELDETTVESLAKKWRDSGLGDLALSAA